MPKGKKSRCTCSSSSTSSTSCTSKGSISLTSECEKEKKTIYKQTNLVSDIAGVARFTDPNLVNSWGIAHSPTSPWWVSDNGTGVSTLYDQEGRAFPEKSPLVVTIPPPTGVIGTSAPTGIVFNYDPNAFIIKGPGGKSGASIFLFATEDGTISGWNPEVNPTNAVLVVDRSTVGLGAVYKGLAIASNKDGIFLYATNFRAGVVEQFDSKFTLVNTFTDPKIANICPIDSQCFAPFNIQRIGGLLFVTFALQDAAKHDDVAGPGNGFVDIFDTKGKLLRRLIKRGVLNSPWGLTRTPKNFGKLSNVLLVGNFGDGVINAFSLSTGKFLGRLINEFGNPITINGLWAIRFGNGSVAGPKNTLFFAAGIGAESHGLFGKIEVQKIK